MRKALRSVWAEPQSPDPPAPQRWDWLLVSGLVAAAVVEGIVRQDVVWRPLAIAMAVVLAVTLPWRRTRPLLVVTATFGPIFIVNLFLLIGGYQTFGLYTMVYVVFLPYSLLRWGSGREIGIGLGIILASISTGIAADFTNVGEAVGGFVFAMSPAVIGAAMRYRGYARFRHHGQAVLREREQLARELHDTVAHHVSAIAIRAQAGQALASANPEAPLEALAVIEQEASKTLSEMRTMVGALRHGDEPELAPIPGVADLERLTRSAGDRPRVDIELSGDLEDLTPVVDAAVYRLAQESITNAITHARHASTVNLSVSGDDRFVRMTVVDDGDAAPAVSDLEPGFGLLGMSERAKLLGGTLEAGPGPDRGWVVNAVLPKNGKLR
jgi:signal transduction histidine kinase